MFAQGGRCFFCEKVLAKTEASVEHLVASSNGGRNSDENCVVCCKAVNALLGSMSLKEKLRVALNQKGNFKCPNGAGSGKAKSKSTGKFEAKVTEERIGQAVKNIKQRGHARPRRVKMLKSMIASLFPAGLSEGELTAIVEKMQQWARWLLMGITFPTNSENWLLTSHSSGPRTLRGLRRMPLRHFLAATRCVFGAAYPGVSQKEIEKPNGFRKVRERP